MNKCVGCGAFLQTTDENKEGYVQNENSIFCRRCFEITHYNKYVKMPFKDYQKKINEIDKNDDLILFVSDFLNLYNIENIHFKSPTMFVMTKADLLPRDISEDKLLSQIKGPFIDKIVVSSKNNYNFDELYHKILKYKKSNNVYVVGFTNAGKSTLINKLIKNYGSGNGELTVSNLPSTTLNLVSNRINADLTIIDTPGILDSGSLMLLLDKDNLKKIMPVKQIRPIIYQIKGRQSLLFEQFMRIDFFNETDVIIYMSNNLKIQRLYKDKFCDLKKYEIKIKRNEVLIVKGLGFIKFKKDSMITLHLLDNVDYLIKH